MRALLIVLDSVGIGAAPDAAAYGDEGSDTLGHILERCPDLGLPTLWSVKQTCIGAIPPYCEGVKAARIWLALNRVKSTCPVVVPNGPEPLTTAR